jgi:hypothetical protein
MTKRPRTDNQVLGGDAELLKADGSLTPIVGVSDMQSATTWAGPYAITTDPGIAGSIFNFNGVPTFSTGFVFRRPGGTDGYIRPSNAGTYNRA